VNDAVNSIVGLSRATIYSLLQFLAAAVTKKFFVARGIRFSASVLTVTRFQSLWPPYSFRVPYSDWRQ